MWMHSKMTHTLMVRQFLLKLSTLESLSRSSENSQSHKVYSSFLCNRQK